MQPWLRNVLYGPEKLRAGWRVLLFVVIGAAVAIAVGNLAAPLAEAAPGLAWRLALPHGVLVVAALVASWVMMAGVERRPLADLGLWGGREIADGLGRGAVVGAVALASIVAVELAVGWIRPEPQAGDVAAWLAHMGVLGLVFAIGAVSEELLFRGYGFQVLVEGLGVPLAVLLNAVAFAAVHVGNPNVGAIPLANVALAGVLLAVVYLRTRSLWVAIGTHWAWNWMMAGPFDLPVSGLDFDAPGYELREAGPDLVTGGAFGVEGGLLATAVLAAVTVWAARSPWLGPSAGVRASEPLLPVEDEGRDPDAPGARRPDGVSGTEAEGELD